MSNHTINILISCSIFIITYVFIILDKFERSIVAMLGAVLMILFKIISQEDEFKEIDYNTLGLLISMMIIVMIIKRTGLFEYLSTNIVKLAKGEPVKIIIFLSIITGVL